MRDVARPEDVRARPGQRPVTVAYEGHFALEDIKRFVLEMVRMVRRRKPWWHQILHESERAVGRLPGRSQDRWESQKVDGRFLGRVDVGLQALCDHRVSLSLGRSRAGWPRYNHHV